MSSFLTWCEECGEDMENNGYICEGCNLELCYNCFLLHLNSCKDKCEEK